MVGHLTLDQAIGVRIPVPQPKHQIRLMDPRSVNRIFISDRPGENLSEAAAYSRQALTLCVDGADARLPSGDRSLNLQRALAHYREALEHIDPQANPQGYRRAQSGLGMVCAERGGVSREDGLLTGIERLGSSMWGTQTRLRDCAKGLPSNEHGDRMMMPLRIPSASGHGEGEASVEARESVSSEYRRHTALGSGRA